MPLAASTPAVSNVSHAAWRAMIGRRYFYPLIILGVLLWSVVISQFSIPLWSAVGFPIFVFLFYFSFEVERARTAFWISFARDRGFVYLPRDEQFAERALLFNQGHSRAATHFVSGEHQGVPTRIFSYHFATGSGKSRQDYYYTVFEFKFAGSFPHCYLNYRYNLPNFSVGEKIPLPAEIEKQFSLQAPKEYEIESLEIFTPDVLSWLLDNRWLYDVEMLDQELLVFRLGRIDRRELLEQEFDHVWRFCQLLTPKLNHARLTEIGDRSPLLS